MKTGTPAFLFISLLIFHIESRVVELGGGRLVRYITCSRQRGVDRGGIDQQSVTPRCVGALSYPHCFCFVLVMRMYAFVV